ncbi:MAG: DUF5519 family protein [Anaerolineaceae bacterium]|nr:DUF5519 family protein [Anaerolineaceae bacterium]
METLTAREQINQAVLGWPDVTAHAHRFGGIEFRLGRRELGHIHGNHVVDIPFPKKVRDEIIAAGVAQPHHVLPDSGWVSFYIRETGDIEAAITLLRRSFELAEQQQSKKK